MPSLSKPTNEQVDAAVSWLSAPHHERYFFKKLNNPHWITPLRERRFFSDAPEPETVEGSGVRCRTWPQSRYLSRMATIAPKEVADILATINTKNWIVASDIIEAAKAMPPHYAAKLAPKIGELVDLLSLWHQLEDVGEVVARLAHGNEADAAIELVKTAFAIRRGLVDRSRRGDEYGYFEGLRGSVIPALAPMRGRDLAVVLIRSMMEAIEIEEGRRSGRDDVSYVWRPAIEDHEQNRDYDFAAKLVGCVRDACALAISEGNLALGDTLQLLHPNSSLIQRRIRVHLINEFADNDVELARQTMIARALFDDSGCKHEYARLISMRFGLLSAAQREEWFGWVDTGPDSTAVDASRDKESQERREQQWKFQRLHWLHHDLTGDRRQFYDQMYEEYGKPELADFVVYSRGVQVGHETPYTSDDLAAMGFEAAVATVARWRRDPGQQRFDAPSLEGLVNSFRRFVETEAVQFSFQAQLLKGKSTPFVRSYLRAMEDAVKQGEQIRLEPVFDLCTWVVSRPVNERTSPVEEESPLIDRDWQWCRDAIANLAQEVCNSRDDAKRPRYGIEHRERLWDLLTPLLDSPTESSVLREESEQDPRVTDWPLLAINSPRGKAMLAVMAYADWVAGHLDPKRREHRAFPGGFDQMPEVRRLLEAQLARPDDAFTARAAFGRRLGLLYWLDAEWLRQHAHAIFDLQVIETESEKAFGWAAWNTFLFANRPHIEFYRILREQFSYAVDQATALEKPQHSREQPFARLAEHLIVLYGRGDLGRDCDEAWNTDNGIIKRLVTQTHESVRSRALGFVGVSLKDAGDDLPEDVIQRFKDLWERYWGTIGAEDAKRNPNSSVFGYWFGSGVLDPEWSIVQLERFVDAAPKADPDHMIMERLADIASADPVRSARIVGMLVDGDTENWRIYSWKDDAKRVLAAALSAGGEAKGVAEQVIDRLGQREYLDFGELLESQARSTS